MRTKPNKKANSLGRVHVNSWVSVPRPSLLSEIFCPPPLAPWRLAPGLPNASTVGLVSVISTGWIQHDARIDEVRCFGAFGFLPVNISHLYLYACCCCVRGRRSEHLHRAKRGLGVDRPTRDITTQGFLSGSLQFACDARKSSSPHLWSEGAACFLASSASQYDESTFLLCPS